MSRPEPRRDRYGRYILPDPDTGRDRPWTRATTLAKTLGDETFLTKWKLRTAALGFTKKPVLLDQVAVADPEDKETLDHLADKALEAGGGGDGAKHGTAVHEWTERWDLGEAGHIDDVPGQYQPDVLAYHTAMASAAVVALPQFVERIVVNRTLDVVGTLDRIVALPDGRWVIGDVKTAKNIHFGWLDIAIQLATYANADLMWDWESESWQEMPSRDPDVGLIMHVPARQGVCALWTVNLIAGWEAALLAQRVREMRQLSRTGMADIVDLVAWRLFADIRHAETVEQLTQLWRDHPHEWTSEHTSFATLRKRELETLAA